MNASKTPRGERRFFDDTQARKVLLESRTYARPILWRSLWQVSTTLGALVALLWISSWVGPLWSLLLIPLMTGLFVRVFVLQHDCGHRSLFHKRQSNDVVGYMLSIITSVPYHAWRTEHNWHHNHQGKLEKRGVDNMNSPMTLDEVPERPDEARYRIAKVRPRNIFLIGVHSLLVERKAPKGFFPFRDAFTDPVKNREQMLRGLIAILPLHIAMQALVIWAFGWWVSALLILPSMMLGAGLGALLFWVQHNFEETYYARAPEWNRANVAAYGSSYLRLNRVFRWFTADIGIHHVHHLNQAIPNYRLDAARQGIEAMRQVSAMERSALKRSFTHLFWDEGAARMRRLDTTSLEPDEESI